MTSSLVGSEMCIRDSTTISERFRAEGANARSNTGGSPMPLCSRHAVSTACLLYTSDAADDM
eukprot:2060600-Prorocentrum_lima.AAC.1